jgi:DNA-binding transcriptional LysR family regulator
MELRHLRYFVAVAEAMNFSKAAHSLHMAQPPLSRQIKQLEDEIGTPLLLRNRGGVVLTDAGRIFLQQAQTILDQSAHALASARRVAKGELGTLRVGIGSGLGYAVKRVLVEHAKRYPEVEIECLDILSTLQNAALYGREIDVGFLRPPIDTEHLVSRKLFDESFSVYLPRSHPLARRRKLRLIQLKDAPLLLYDRAVSSGVYDKTLELYRHAGFSPKIIRTRTAPYEEAGALLVAAGKGIYIGVGAIRGKPGSHIQVVTVRLDEPDAKVAAHLAWRRGETSAVVLAFVESVRRIFGFPC